MILQYAEKCGGIRRVRERRARTADEARCVLEARRREDDLVGLLEHLVGALHRSAWRQCHRNGDDAAIGRWNEARGCHHDEHDRAGHEARVDDQHDGRSPREAAHISGVAALQRAEPAVEKTETRVHRPHDRLDERLAAVLGGVVILVRLEEAGAQGRRKRQGNED